MKAMQLMAPGEPRIVELPMPKIESNEVLVKVKACVTCPHWDITLFRGVDIFERPGYPKYPIPPGYPGHEMAGEITAIGARVKKFKVGDRVAALCTAGEDKPGFYADYVSRPEDTITLLPDNVSFDTGASMEMARFVHGHLKVLEPKGLRTAVVGLGPAGLIALQMLVAKGARDVIGIDVLPDRLQLARRLGATDTVNPAVEADLQKLVAKPLQASVDCSGAAAGLQVALDHTCGPVVVFGVVHGDAKFSTRHWFRGTYIPQRFGPDEKDTEAVLDLWRTNKLDTASLISARLPFADYAKGVTLLIERKAIRVCFHPG